MKILIVDDEPIMRNLLTDILRDEGYQTSTADNGAEAVTQARMTRFNIIFCDIHMPVMNGVEAIRKIKDINPRTVIVMMDSYPDSLVQQAVKDGALTCIHKPFDIQDVRNLLTELASTGALGV